MLASFSFRKKSNKAVLNVNSRLRQPFAVLVNLYGVRVCHRFWSFRNLRFFVKLNITVGCLSVFIQRVPVCFSGKE